MTDSAPWSICIDTGGTFTDCLATDPAGTEHRCKVLSSSAVRGVVTELFNPTTLAVDFHLSLPNQFFTGFECIFLDDPDTSYSVTGFDAETSRLILDRSVSSSTITGKAVELRSPEEAPILATRIITQTPSGSPFPPLEMRLSTTKGTNALLERSGAKTLFLITEGFGDLLRIKNQQRPELFSLNIQKTPPFYRYVVEVPERLDADGDVLNPLDEAELKKRIKPHLDEIKSAGICLMHGYKNPEHEIRVQEILEELGVPYVSRSSALSPEIKIVPRAVTTDVNAYLSPIMERYLERISTVVQGHSLRVMNSGGSLVESDNYRPKDGLLSGPAGGVFGAVAIGERVSSNKKNLQGFAAKRSPGRNLGGLSNKIISFDMGGTSTDVARYDGSVDYLFEHTVGDATLNAPAVEIETVASGGGSICGFDGQSLTVGPESAGAEPGPACYGRGGPLTITDVNLLSGRLHRDNFHISIVPEAAEQRLGEVMDQISAAELREEDGYTAEQYNQIMSRKEVLEGFLDIANERMAQAIRKISIQKGFDPSDYALVAFGGAGAQHALGVARKLKINTVLVPHDAGILSAYGLQQSRQEQMAVRQVLKPLSTVLQDLESLFASAEEEAIKRLQKQGVNREDMTVTLRQLFLRFAGQDSSLEIDWSPEKDPEKVFKKAYQAQYGHLIDNRDIEVEAVRVKMSENSPLTRGDTGGCNSPLKGAEIPDNRDLGDDRGDLQSIENLKEVNPKPDNSSQSPFGKVHSEHSLKPGTKLTGPALILNPHSTTVIEEGWEGALLEDGTWVLKDLSDFKNLTSLKEKKHSDAVSLQLYTNRFRSVADQMGEMLRKTSMSVNVKERLDFSCALLDADGYLVVNAPHIPVHLGAMGTCVRSLLKNLQGFENLGGLGIEEGDVLITNHPGFGGSHLPDVTVVTPIFYNDERIGFAASRAHHAEIGGKRPGSMPPDANNLAEEGVVIPPMMIARKGEFRWKELEELLTNSTWPSRSVDENLADIRAAVSANHRGVTELQQMAKTFGMDEVTSYMNRLKEYASGRMKSTLGNIEEGEYSAEEKLDKGSILSVTCSVKGETLTIDFTGTSNVNPGNLNANPSIVHSVIMYVLRLLIDEPLPLNDGLLEPVEIRIPKGMLNPVFPDDPEECPAVVGGNIETSQRLTDTLLKAFGAAACSYGTMNNVLFGNNSFGYYETVAGGTGAGDGFHGADAVHQHMTNTRATDPEILEHRYPVRLDRYAIRKQSGGNGKWNGGNGLIRELTFLEPVSLSVLSQHRVVKPYGLNGGKPGNTGQHWVERSDGTKQNLKWRDGAELETGDRFILQTPGGGGFGVR